MCGCDATCGDKPPVWPQEAVAVMMRHRAMPAMPTRSHPQRTPADSAASGGHHGMAAWLAHLQLMDLQGGLASQKHQDAMSFRWPGWGITPCFCGVCGSSLPGAHAWLMSTVPMVFMSSSAFAAMAAAAVDDAIDKRAWSTGNARMAFAP